FGDKRTLFDEAVAVYDRRYGGFIRAALDQEATAVVAMRRILAEAPARYTRRGLPRGCLVRCGDVGTEDAQVRASLSRMRQENADQLRNKIEADVVAGVLPDGIDAAGLAGYVLAVLNGMVLQARDGATRQDLEKVVGLAKAALPAVTASLEGDVPSA
ncbi:TetR family transcriptional regulator C-terminal domain-containing protein, partial [Micropruina sp.]|uniref:TetR family transcriptional regulator C-terminal domain-containing protein n=1 Tax=Micropruina sp. TaxID=2737536 RepID=UPI0039E64F04